MSLDILNLGRDTPANGRFQGRVHDQVNLVVQSAYQKLAQVREFRKIYLAV